MTPDDDFDLAEFLPYLLNQAAEEAGLAFQSRYKARYGMLRTEWRVLFHLGRYGGMPAREIGERGKIHKTKISRAVKALERKHFLTRRTSATDRRHEDLALTPAGRAAYVDLSRVAQEYDQSLAAQFTEDEQAVLRRCLKRLAQP